MKLYIYEHCPFCARVRYIAGRLGVPLDIEVLAYHDEATPTRLVGKKIVPILQLDDGRLMTESLEIIDMLIKLHLPAPAELTPSPAVLAWQRSAFPLLQKIGYPRWHHLALKEFATAQSRASWQARKESPELNFMALMTQTTTIVNELESLLEQATVLLTERDSLQPQAMLDNAILYSILRGYACEPSINWPPALHRWLRQSAELSSVPLVA
ncbi:glutaredoxin 2 [Photobacterium sp. TY1-4]|uniref:glutaredoxin 2 n=1 Tax=Photobacterium sp. TY1-4 TaxID=2899122 RepID=UPI0021BEEDD4|nr:glutaredoxin 2 [Photobacterium sp. TY1-4]UXI00172.1 glutaredoxin 2 [Photobacterium sp. TY1-4]